MVRAKFAVTYLPEGSTDVHLSPVYSGSEENKQFYKSTPGGSISLNVLNEDARKYFEQGKEYYIDFTTAE